MQNSIVVRIPPDAQKILMEDCKALYEKNYPNRKGCRITIAEMMMEVVTFYRDADGWIIRPSPGKKK